VSPDRPVRDISSMTDRLEVAPIPDVAFELLERCERQARWIRTAGLDRGDLQAATDSATDLVFRAEELRALLSDELARRSPRARSPGIP